MKKIAKEKLDQLLFSDREKKIKAVKDNQEQYSVRSYFMYIIDQQINGAKTNRETVKMIDKIYDALKEGDLILEDAEFEHLKKHIDGIGIPVFCVYKECVSVIDTAEEYKVS